MAAARTSLEGLRFPSAFVFPLSQVPNSSKPHLTSMVSHGERVKPAELASLRRNGKI